MNKATKLLFIFLFCLEGVTPVFSQQKEKNWFSIEIDPISTIFGARTFSGIIEPKKINHWSIFTNVVSADFPEWMDDLLNPHNKGKGFKTKIQIGGGLGIDYAVMENRQGLYFGLIHLFFQNEIEKNGSTANLLTGNLIPRMGYKWYLGNNKSLYLNPFVGVRCEYDFVSSVQISGENYSVSGVQPFGTIHIGYNF